MIEANYYMFCENTDDQFHPLSQRIAADCLGNAITVAKEIAIRRNLTLIGVAPDLVMAVETGEQYMVAAA